MGLSDWKKQLLNTGYLKPIGTTLVVTGLSWLVYGVYSTINTFKTVGHMEVISHVVQYIHIDEKITRGLVLGKQGNLEYQLGWHGFANWIHRSKYRLACRLLHLAQTAPPEFRLLAVYKLATSHHLSESDMIQLAQTCDPHTAVGLARCYKSRQGFFLPPPTLYKLTGREDLIKEIKYILHKLNQDSGHLCVKSFISDAFPEYENMSNYQFDSDVTQVVPWTILATQDNLLPMCVQALDHHVSTLNNEKFLVELGGLPMLMAVHQHLKDDNSVSKLLCRLLSTICSHSEFLPQVYASGWVGVLRSWLSSDDEQLSLLAGHCLANLDRDESTNACYGKHVIPLHPTHRAQPPLVDVVFVHGLLGGVLSTWRQRNDRDTTIIGLQKEDILDSRQQHSSDEHTQEYLSAMTELTISEWEQLGSDYDFVVSDFPISCDDQDCQQYTLSGEDKYVRQYGNDQSYSMCWPKDWLPTDCSSIRVLGIDYESRLSDWFPKCCEKLRMKTLEERSSIVLEELKQCGIGKRPIVWVAHSMGGLLVKKMLTEAMTSCDYKTRRLVYNSKAIVFLSTPHLGCPLAEMNDVLNYLLWPSTEVEELRQSTLEKIITHHC